MSSEPQPTQTQHTPKSSSGELLGPASARSSQPAELGNPSGSAPPPSPTPAAQAVPDQPEESQPRPPESSIQDDIPESQLGAQLTELDNIISDVEALKFLRPRLVRCQKEGAQASSLISFYRLAALTLKEEIAKSRQLVEHCKTDLKRMRAKVDQAELKLAMNQAVASDDPSAPVPKEAPAPATEATPRDEVMEAKMAAELERAHAQRERLLQDMQNMRNRAQIDVEIKAFKAVEKFTGSLLPALDAFNQAMPSLQKSQDIDAVVTGVEMIYGQIKEALEKAGLTEIEAVGQPFDPKFHEAVGEVDTEEMPDEYVYDQFQTGYLFGERLLRPAMVRVSRNPNSPAPPAAAPASEEPASKEADPPTAEDPKGSVSSEESAGHEAEPGPASEAPAAPPSVKPQEDSEGPAEPAEAEATPEAGEVESPESAPPAQEEAPAAAPEQPASDESIKTEEEEPPEPKPTDSPSGPTA